MKQFSFKAEKKDEQVLKFLVEKFLQQFFIILQENKQNIMMLYSYLEQCAQIQQEQEYYYYDPGKRSVQKYFSVLANIFN